MKKLIALLMVLACILTLVACGDDDKTTTTTTSAQGGTTTSTTTTTTTTTTTSSTTGSTGDADAKTLYNAAVAQLIAPDAGFKFNFISTVTSGDYSDTNGGYAVVDGANFMLYMDSEYETVTITVIGTTSYNHIVDKEDSSQIKMKAEGSAAEIAAMKNMYIGTYLTMLPELSDAALAAVTLVDNSFTMTLSAADYEAFIALSGMPDSYTITGGNVTVAFNADGSLKSVRNVFDIDTGRDTMTYDMGLTFEAPTAVTAPADADQYVSNGSGNSGELLNTYNDALAKIENSRLVKFSMAVDMDMGILSLSNTGWVNIDGDNFQAQMTVPTNNSVETITLVGSRLYGHLVKTGDNALEEKVSRDLDEAGIQQAWADYILPYLSMILNIDSDTFASAKINGNTFTVATSAEHYQAFLATAGFTGVEITNGSYTVVMNGDGELVSLTNSFTIQHPDNDQAIDYTVTLSLLNDAAPVVAPSDAADYVLANS